MQTIPAFFFPTQTIVIDDNAQFLESLSLSLSYQTTSYKFFNNPLKALSYINKNIDKGDWIKKHIKSVEEEEAAHKTIDINIGDIYKEIFNRERFNIITNVVVDFDMPIVNGLELCKKIKNININYNLLKQEV